MNPGVLTQVEAEDRLHYWQGMLRLGDWNLVVDIARRQEIDDVLGRIRKSDMRDARVLLADPIDIVESPYNVNTDMEVTLVHELLHARFHDIGEIDSDSPEHRNLEAAIEATAQALVALDRKVRFQR